MRPFPSAVTGQWPTSHGAGPPHTSFRLHLPMLGQSLIFSSELESTNYQVSQNSSHPHRVL